VSTNSDRLLCGVDSEWRVAHHALLVQPKEGLERRGCRQRIEGGHVGLIDREVEDVQILGHPLGLGRLWDAHEPGLV